MSERPPTLLEVLEAAVDGATSDLRVSLPGRIESYDSSTRRATVQVLITDGVVGEDETRRSKPIPALFDVPVAMWGSGSVRIKLTPKAGDPCWLLFSSSSLARFKTTGGRTVVDPGDDRHHHLADAIAIPCVTVGDAGSAPLIEFTDAAVLLASSLAAQSILRGEAFLSAFGTLITAISSAFTSITAGAPAGGGAAGTAVAGALTAFQNAAPTYKTTSVKVP